jgi:hypothetical protein
MNAVATLSTMIDQLRQLWKARPFVPFVIHLKDGRSFPVSDPAYFHIFPLIQTKVFYLDANEDFEWLSISEMERIELRQEVAAH